jgi:flagellar hook-associated protein 1
VRITSSEAGGSTANDLRDQRDLRLDELSKIAGTRVIPQPNGSVSVRSATPRWSKMIRGARCRCRSSRPIRSPARRWPTCRCAAPRQLARPARAACRRALGDGRRCSTPRFPVRSRLDAMASQLVSTAVNTRTPAATLQRQHHSGRGGRQLLRSGFTVGQSGALRARSRCTARGAGDPNAIAASGNPNGPTDNSSRRSSRRCAARRHRDVDGRRPAEPKAPVPSMCSSAATSRAWALTARGVRRRGGGRQSRRPGQRVANR